MVQKRTLLNMFTISILAVCVIASIIISYKLVQQSQSKVSEPVDIPSGIEEIDEWIIKWQAEANQPTSEKFVIVSSDLERQTMLVKLDEGMDVLEWYLEITAQEHIEYVKPNQEVKINEIQEAMMDTLSPVYISETEDGEENLPVYISETEEGDTESLLHTDLHYLEQINAYRAWEIEDSNTNVTIAILDTGVDLHHSELSENLVPGYNVLDPKSPPHDDHGHGTNLAGIVGAVGNNDLGVRGILKRTKIMPVKVISASGTSNVYPIGQGIFYAVDNGADIILLSSGTPIYDPYMQEAVEYAEENGVIVIAATGNEGLRVNFPAAYPTVIAVGAVDRSLQPTSYTNSGPEVTVVAPGTVYTTSFTGEYVSRSGTSMAAPQVAGLAALILERNPNLVPSEVRNHIIYTSRDAYGEGWDQKTGHGQIDMAKALRTRPVPHIYDPNSSLSMAAPFPIETIISAKLSNRWDEDWYQIDTEYAGEISLNVFFPVGRTEGVELAVFLQEEGEEERETIIFNITKSKEVLVTVPRGTTYIRLKFEEEERRTFPLRYEIINTFTIYADEQQPNDTKEEATRLHGDGAVITGTVHRDNMQDWFYFDVPYQGQIQAGVTVDTIRLDPVIMFERPNGESKLIDDGDQDNGQTERLVTDVEPGRHYFMIYNYYHTRVNGEYYFRLTYKPYFIDIHEPNNSRETATSIQFLREAEANISNEDDVDWYYFRMNHDREVGIDVENIPPQVGLEILLFDEENRLLGRVAQEGEESSIHLEVELESGKYYLLIMAETPFPFESYSIKIN